MPQVAEQVQSHIDEILVQESVHGELVSQLRDSIRFVGHDLGFDYSSFQTGDREPFDQFITDKVREFEETGDPELGARLDRISEYIELIDHERAADNWKPGRPATRAGVEQGEIAKTFRGIAYYLRELNVGEEFNRIADEWLKKGGLVDSIEKASQAELRAIFGHGEWQHYWPGGMTDIMVDIVEVLEFRAYRDKLHHEGDRAQKLIDRIRAFRGISGSVHCSITSRDREVMKYIGETPRHRTERYLDPEDSRVDEINIRNFTFDWTARRWLPVDGEHVECRLGVGGTDSYSHFNEHARLKHTLEQGFLDADIDAEVRVELGDKYGEDAVVIKMRDEELARYISAAVNQRLDLENGDTEYSCDNMEDVRYCLERGMLEGYSAFVRGVPAFHGPEGGYYNYEELLDQDHPNAREIRAIWNWLVESKAVEFKDVTLPEHGKESARYLVIDHGPRGNFKDAIVVGNRFYTDCDIYNEINGKKAELVRLVNRYPKVEKAKTNLERSLPKDILYDGDDVYVVASGSPYYQIGHYLRDKYGIEHRWEYELPEELRRCYFYNRGESCYRYSLGSLPEEERKDVRTHLISLVVSVQQDLRSGGDGLIGLVDRGNRATALKTVPLQELLPDDERLLFNLIEKRIKELSGKGSEAPRKRGKTVVELSGPQVSDEDLCVGLKQVWRSLLRGDNGHLRDHRSKPQVAAAVNYLKSDPELLKAYDSGKASGIKILGFLG